ncbi:hypothetical protein [Pedobacter heparinus]|uniref:hypothetical protein n=1 Tax=Pedobacter heparinus TaxID=984 RepID=UPI0029309925|nr:hypothetical protein [Pedobacter heparinus]
MERVLVPGAMTMNENSIIQVEGKRLMKAKNPVDMKLLYRRLWDVVHFEELFPVPVNQHIDEFLLSLIIELSRLCLEEDRGLAIAKYYHNKTQLLQLQRRAMELLADANKKQRKRIGLIDAGLTELLDVLELVKTERIDTLFFKPN